MTPDHFHSLARLLPEPLLLVTTEGAILGSNESARRLLRLGPDGVRLADRVIDPGETVERYLLNCSRSAQMIPGLLSFSLPGEPPTPIRLEGAVFRPWSPEEPALVVLRLKPKTAAESRFILLNEKIEELGREVNERRHVEAALRESEQRFRTLADAAPVMIWMADLEGNYSFFNNGWLRFAGRRAEEETGLGWRARVHSEDLPGCLSAFQTAVRSGASFRREYRLRRSDGIYRWVLDHGVPLHLGNGSPGRYIGSAIDIHENKESQHLLQRLNDTLENRVRRRTAVLARLNSDLRREIDEREKAQQALAAANTLLEQRNRELQEFAYVASHDLQEPLRKIRAFTELLQTEQTSGLEDEPRYYLQRIEDAAARMSQLIIDLLAFSRVSTQAQTFRRVDLNNLVHEVLEDLEVSLTESKGRVEADDLCNLEADPVQMKQLLQNLIGNALKYRKEGEPPVIRVRGSILTRALPGFPEPRRVCRLEVQDNGIGFDPRHEEKLFSPFQRLHSRQEYPGTGIGLAICRRIVERHSGSISATSVPGEGSTFTVLLPLEQSGLPAKAASPSPE